MVSLWQDLRFAFRTLGKSKGFTAIAVLTLALGIGINAAVFTLTNAWLFKGFPFDKNNLILYLGSKDLSHDFPFGPVSYPDFRDWQAQAKSFDGLATASGMQMNLSDDAGLPETHRAARMSANSFQVIGQKPFAGRDFTAADGAPGAAPVAILTYGLWERRYGKNLSIIGRTVRMNGISTTVIGIMPRDFSFPFDGDLWIPNIPTPEDSVKRDARNMIVFGRMAAGVTVQSARAEMNTIAQNLQRAYPLTNQGFAPVVLTYNEFYNGPRIFVISTAMLVAVAFVLLIACANVANLLLARAVGRSREISIRIALGAGRWRLVRQLLVESLLLSAAGGFLGWLIAKGATRIFDVVTTPMGKPSWIDFSMDVRVFAYLVAVSIGTGLLFGLAPALRLSKIDVHTGLKEGGRGSSAGVHGKKLSRLLVIGEMALAIVLLAGAGLMIRSFLNIYRASLGVSTANVLTMRLPLPAAKYPQPSDQITFHDRLHVRLASLPGVESVAIANFLPTGGSSSFRYELEGAISDPQRRPSLSALIVSPGYFHVMSVGILQGRDFTEADGVSGTPVAIVNQRFATLSWPGQDPLGKRLRLYPGNAPEAWLTVVGLVPNIVQNENSPSQVDPLIYLPYRAKPQPDMAIVARTRVPPGTLGTAFRREIQAADSDLPIYNLWTLEERLQRNYWFYQVIGILFAIFAGIALLLASVGLYATMAHSVSQRTQEIGVRMAMGATGDSILRLVFMDGMRQLAIGLVLGLAAAFAVMNVLKSVLVQVSPADPGTFVIASAILIAAALLGCWLPARRATRVDPMVALRYE